MTIPGASNQDSSAAPAAHALYAEALAFLGTHLGERAPQTLTPVGEFDEAPLEGEGRTTLFSFDLPGSSPVGGGSADGERRAQPAAAAPVAGSQACAAQAARHYVAVGCTAPNYFPAYDLTPDQAYSLHVGTRFMLEMELQRVDASLEPPSARETLQRLLADRQAVLDGPVELAALFRCEDEFYAVYRVSVDGAALYYLGADCPPGFYAMTQFPPQAALRLHLGQLIRREARSAVQFPSRREREAP